MEPFELRKTRQEFAFTPKWETGSVQFRLVGSPLELTEDSLLTLFTSTFEPLTGFHGNIGVLEILSSGHLP